MARQFCLRHTTWREAFLLVRKQRPRRPRPRRLARQRRVYNPNNASTQVFDQAFLKMDSDQAFVEAQKHGGDKILEKDPTTPVRYICDWNHNTNQLIWHVIYGASRETAKLTVAVDATTGEFIRVEK